MSEKQPLTLSFPQGESLPLWAFLFSSFLSMLLAISSTIMLTSAFQMDVDGFAFFFFVPPLAFFFSYLHARKDIRITLITLGALALFTGFVLYFDILSIRYATEMLFSEIVLNAGGTYSSENAFAVTSSLVFISIIPIFVTTWVIMRGKNVIFAVLAFLPIVISTFSVISHNPSTAASLFFVSGVLLLILFQNVRKCAKEKTFQDLLKLFAPILVLLVFFAILNPQDRYSQDSLAKKRYSSIQAFVEEISERFKWGIGARAERETRALSEMTYKGSVVMDNDSTHALHMYVENENLLNVGNFNVPEWKFMTVVREKNNKFSGKSNGANPYMYLKTSSMERFDGYSWAATSADLTLSDYFSSSKELEREARYILRFKMDFGADYSFIPYYMDLNRVDPDSSALVESPELTMHESYNMNEKVALPNLDQEYVYAYSNTPVRYTPKWTEEYLEQIYSECLYVPDTTRDKVLQSEMLPSWYMDIVMGMSDWPTEKVVEEVMNYVRNIHPYDNNTDFPPLKEDFVYWFMRKSETGFCVHYATTAVVLLRLAGIPARYVKGYFLTGVEDGVACDVKSTDAHAWIEYFHADYGWIMDDPTPGNEVAASFYNFNAIVSEYGPATTQITPRPKNVKTPNRVAVSDDGSEGSAVKNENEETQNTKKNMELFTFEKFFNRIMRFLLFIVIAAIVLGVVAFILRCFFHHYWKKRFRDKDLNASSRAYYRYYETMARILKGEPTEDGGAIARKAAFSRKGISEEERRSMIKKEEKNLDVLFPKANLYRRNVFDILTIRKELPL